MADVLEMEKQVLVRQLVELGTAIRAELAKGRTAQRIYQDLVTDQGYEGSYDAVQRYGRRLREKAPAVYARLHPLRARA